MATSIVNTFFQDRTDIIDLQKSTVQGVRLYHSAAQTSTIEIPGNIPFLVFTSRTSASTENYLGLYIGQAYLTSDGADKGVITTIKQGNGVELSIAGKTLTVTTTSPYEHITVLYVSTLTTP